MKTRNLLIAAVALCITACQEDESIQQGQVQFSFSAADVSEATGRKPISDVPPESSLRISVASENGDVIFTSKKIELIKNGASFLTDPIKLKPGRYVITDFMIVSKQDSLLFAIPRSGSKLADWVKSPLPIAFSVGSNATNNIEGEVIEAARKKSEDFGYTAFNVKVAPVFGLSIAAFTNTHGKMNLATANAAILHGTDTVFQKTLTASVNGLNFKGDATETYTLVLTKDGFAKYTQIFSLSTLSSDPLSVVLQPALTVTWTLPGSTIYLDGRAGAQLSIDWGDNAVENTPLQNTGYSHTYATSGKYFVSITGDLDAITFFEIEYQDGINHVSPIHLPELEDFRLPLCQYTSRKIDFSANTKLSNIDLGGVRGNLSDIDISNNVALLNIDLQADVFPDTVINKLIDNLYASCQANNRKNGYMNIHTVLYDNPYNPANRNMIGPPSAAQVEKLNKLINDYQWFVFPINTLTLAEASGRIAVDAKSHRRPAGKLSLLYNR